MNMVIKKLNSLPDSPEKGNEIVLISNPTSVEMHISNKEGTAYHKVNSFTYEPNLLISDEIEINETVVCQITNYDSFHTYEISCNNGTIIKENVAPDGFKYIAPATEGDDTIFINNKSFPIKITGIYNGPSRPVMSFPYYHYWEVATITNDFRVQWEPYYHIENNQQIFDSTDYYLDRVYYQVSDNIFFINPIIDLSTDTLLGDPDYPLVNCDLFVNNKKYYTRVKFQEKSRLNQNYIAFSKWSYPGEFIYSAVERPGYNKYSEVYTYLPNTRPYDVTSRTFGASIVAAYENITNKYVFISDPFKIMDVYDPRLGSVVNRDRYGCVSMYKFVDGRLEFLKDIDYPDGFSETTDVDVTGAREFGNALFTGYYTIEGKNFLLVESMWSLKHSNYRVSYYRYIVDDVNDTVIYYDEISTDVGWIGTYNVSSYSNFNLVITDGSITKVVDGINRYVGGVKLYSVLDKNTLDRTAIDPGTGHSPFNLQSIITDPDYFPGMEFGKNIVTVGNSIYIVSKYKLDPSINKIAIFINSGYEQPYFVKNIIGTDDSFGDAIWVTDDNSFMAVGSPSSNNGKGKIHIFSFLNSNTDMNESIIELPTLSINDGFGSFITGYVDQNDGSLYLAVGTKTSNKSYIFKFVSYSNGSFDHYFLMDDFSRNNDPATLSTDPTGPGSFIGGMQYFVQGSDFQNNQTPANRNDMVSLFKYTHI